LALATRLGQWLTALAILPVQLLIDVPRILWRVRQPIRPRLLTLTDDELPDAGWIALTDAAEALIPAGFVLCGTFRSQELIPDATLWIRLLAHHEQGIIAVIAYAEWIDDRRPPEFFAEFFSAFADDRMLVTHNRPWLYPTPPPGWLARIAVRAVQDPQALYVLHRDLVASLPQTLNPLRIAQSARDPARLLTDQSAREIAGLIEEGWMRMVGDGRQVRFSLRGAVACVWRQTPLWANLQRAREERQARRLLAEHELDAGALTGPAAAIVVDRQPFHAPFGAPMTAGAIYEKVRSLARRIDPNATLEGVLIHLDSNSLGGAAPHRFCYTFRSSDRHYQRRIYRLRRFDILLDPAAGVLSVTAIHREALQARDQTEWQRVANPPLSPPLRLGPWLVDLDEILPIAWQTLSAQAQGQSLRLDSALLCNDPDTPCWRVTAETAAPPRALAVMINAYTGVIRA
jgi:hypothetical protein